MRKEWKKSLLVFKMSQRSLFECSVSKKCKADESDLADNAESVPTSAPSNQPQQPTKKQKPSSQPGRPIHASKMFGSSSLTGLYTMPSQNTCSVKSVMPRKARTFSQMKAQLCIFLW